MPFPESVDTVTITCGPVLDADGNPRAGVKLYAIPAHHVFIAETKLRPGILSAATGADGTASLEVIATDSAGLADITGATVTSFRYRIGLDDISTASSEREVYLPKAFPTVAYEDLVANTAAITPAGLSSTFVTRDTLECAFVAAVSSATNLTTYTFSGASLGAAAPDRTIALALGWHGAAITLSSVTIAGVTATIDATHDNTPGHVAIVHAPVPTGTTGDIVVTLSGEAGRIGVGIYAITGAGATASSTDTDTASVAVTGDREGIILAAWFGGTPGTWGGITASHTTATETTWTVTSGHTTATGATTITNSGTTSQALAAVAYSPADPASDMLDARSWVVLPNTPGAPSTNPATGGYLYTEGGALKYRGSAGTVTTIANA